MFNLSSLAIIQKHILLSTGVPSSAARQWLVYASLPNVMLTTSTDTTQNPDDNFIKGDTQDEIIAEDKDETKNPNEPDTTTNGGTGGDDKSSTATPLADPLSSPPVTPPSPEDPPASSKNNDDSTLII